MESWSPAGRVPFKELNILLVGPRRTGKSSTGNTVLGRGRVFDPRGGGTSTAASSITAGYHVTVVDAQGWGSSEEFVPQDEKIELMRALDLCGPEGPHVVLLVIPLLDFTEPERRAVERRMEILTSAVWRHTLVLFTLGDWLRRQGRSVQEHIQSGGPALHWLMDKCRYRYHVLDNKTSVITQNKRLKQEVNGRKRKQEGTWQRKDHIGAGRKNRVGEADEKKEGEQQQVRELLSKVEDMLQENGAWHFSLHMYQRLEEEWSHREQQLRARLEAEIDMGRERRKEKTTETKISMETEEEQGLETEEEEREGSLRKEQENKEDCVERKINREEDKEQRVKMELQRQSSEEDGEDAGCDSAGEKEEERRVIMEWEKEESCEVKTRVRAPCWPNVGQRLTFSPVRRLA